MLCILPLSFVSDYKLFQFGWFMIIKESTVSKHSAFTFVCAFRRQIELNYDVWYFFAFSLLVTAVCCSCGLPLSSKCRGNTLNLNDCILVMINVCSGGDSDSVFTPVVLYHSFYFLFNTHSPASPFFSSLPLTFSSFPFSLLSIPNTHKPLKEWLADVDRAFSFI